jgi:anthranilate/para-aminobenzoate synthase component I
MKRWIKAIFMSIINSLKFLLLFVIEKSVNIKDILFGIAAIIAVFHIPEYKVSVEYKNEIKKQRNIIDKTLETIKDYGSDASKRNSEQATEKNEFHQMYQKQKGFIDEINKLQDELRKE